MVTWCDGQEKLFRFDIRLVGVIDWLVAGHGSSLFHIRDNVLHVRVAGDHYARHVGRAHESRGRQHTVFDLLQPQVLSYFQLVAARALTLFRLRVMLVAVRRSVRGGVGVSVPPAACAVLPTAVLRGLQGR